MINYLHFNKIRSPLSAVVIFFLLNIFIFTVFNIAHFKYHFIIKWDVFGYYLYLPAIFIYNGLFDLSFVPALSEAYNASDGLVTYGTTLTNDGVPVLKFTGGLSVLMLPFFLCAHLVALNSYYPADGLSLPYQLAIVMAALFYSTIGLIVLREILLRYFSDRSTALTILLIALGTNYFYYVTVESGMSHIYLFTLLTLIIYFTIKWHDYPKIKYAIAIGLSLGLATWIRPSDAIFALVPLLWGIANREELIIKLEKFKRNFSHLIIVATLIVLICGLQFLYWKGATGNWFVYSYKGEGGFDFTSPEIWKGLFSYQKGWFVYTPLMLIAVIGVFFLNKNVKQIQLLLVVFLLINIYVVLSWNPWWYGGSFGMRPMIDSYALLAFPLAALITFISRRKKILVPFLILFSFLIILNIIQADQRRTGMMHWESMDKEMYWDIFMKIRR